MTKKAAFLLTCLACSAAAQPSLEQLVNDLRDDEVWGNAEVAVDLLARLHSHERDNLLIAALHSDDSQQRRFAVRALSGSAAADQFGLQRDVPAPLRQLTLTAQSVDALIANLASDEERLNAVWSARTLMESANRDESFVIGHLEEALDSQDEQQSLRAAWVLASRPAEWVSSHTVRTLVSRLSVRPELSWRVPGLLQSLLRDQHPDALDAVENALTSDDWRTRQHAGRLLAALASEDYTPTLDLIPVLSEALRDDDIHLNCYTAMEFLVEKWPQLGSEQLEAAVDSEDFQQYFCAAYALAITGRHSRMARIVEIMLPHLADDTVDYNATLSATALRFCGTAVLPHIHPRLNSEDDQTRALAGQIWTRIHSGEPSEKERRRARRLYNERMNWLTQVMSRRAAEQEN